MVFRQLYGFIGFFAVGLVAAALAWLCGALGAAEQRKSVQRWCYRRFLSFWHVKVTVEGALEDNPSLVVANHCSYVDVGVITVLGDVRFTPKSEVQRWFMLGRIARAFDVIFVDRDRSQAKQGQDQLQEVLNQGNRICVFPEGTTNNGRTLLPFKSTLFSLVEQWQGEHPLKVKPVVIRYDSVDGQPMDDAAWEKIAWYGETTLIAHLWILLSLKEVQVTVICLPALTLSGGKNRKWLSQQSYDTILAHLPHAVPKEIA